MLVVSLAVVGVLVLGRFGLMLAAVVRARGAHAPPPQDAAGAAARVRPVTEPVSVIVPAYNERECIASTVRSLAGERPPASR